MTVLKQLVRTHTNVRVRVGPTTALQATLVSRFVASSMQREVRNASLKIANMHICV